VFIEHKKLIDENTLFQFEGEKSRDNCNQIPEKLLAFVKTERLKKNIFRLSVELIQHFVKLGDYGNVRKNFFIKLGYSNKKYLLYFAEKLNTQDAKKYEDAINEINKKSLNDLKELYKNIMREGMFSIKTPPLGIIDMKRYSKNNILYNNAKLDEEYSYFELILQFCK
jgi:hypothetical protein